MKLPDLIDYDTLLMAPALAVRDGARPVVAELLAVANNPDRLLGIDPTLIRVRAADLLSLQHDPDLLDDAVAILREAVAQALPDEQGMAQDALVKTLAEQGNRAELDAIARDLLGQPPSLPWVERLDSMSSIATIFGYGREATGWLDEALAAPVGPLDRPDRTIGPMLTGAKERLVKIRATMTADGCDPDDPVAAQERMRTLPTAAETVSSYPPWPLGFEGRLLWWPEPDYARVTRQLPELATVLGSPWRGHTGRVQAVMTGTTSEAVEGGGSRGVVHPGSSSTDPAAGRAAQPHSLVAADFTQFAQFLEWSRADPLASSTMTAFGALATKLSNPVRWPPKDRAPCWCGSGARYRDCCARRGAAD